MKKILLLGLLGLMGLWGFQAQGQAVGCDDTVRWGTPLTFKGNNCCWTVLEGPTDCFYASYNQIDCNYDTLADHRFLSPWVEVPSFAATDSVVLIYHTQVSCTAEYSVAITTDGVNYDTLRHRLVDSYQHDTLLLGAYAGQVIRIQLCHYGLNSTFDPYAAGCSYAADYNWQLLFQGLQWRSLVYPVATCTVPTKTYTRDTTWLQASLTEGSHTGLTYTWHSSLTGQTWTGDTVPVVYTIEGVDTITLVAGNAFGSDTLVRTVTVVDCPTVITAHPWKVDFLNEYDCWRTVGTVGWSYASRNISGKTFYGISAAHNSGGANIIASPAVVLPADSTGLRLYWKDSRLSSGSSTYYVLVSTTSRYDITEYDTIFTCTSQTSNVTQRSVSLANYAGDTVYIAFCKMLQNGRTVFITDVQMYNALAPIGVMYAPNYARVGETTNYTVTLSQGDTLGLTVTLHSALKDSSWAMNADALGNGSWGLDVVYDTPGEETVTVTASNAQGTLMLNASLSVFVCNTVSTFPWAEDFSDAGGSYNACWTINGYSHKNINYSSYDEETNEYWTLTNYMRPSAAGNYMITPPIAIPANETNMTFMVEYVRGALDIRVSSTASTDTALFTDLLFTEPTSNYIKRRWVSLGAYTGQTIRVALVTSNPNSQSVNRVWVGVDTLPYMGLNALVPAKVHADSTGLCTISLAHGSTDGLHYTWTSKVGGVITTNALGDSAWVSYSAGFSSTEDTITVVAANAYGADTVAKPLHIIDCSPALTLPWKETFADGDVCWYKPEGSNWHDTIPNNNASQEHLRHLFSHCTSDTIDSWIMSKAITIPADTTEAVRLFWRVASSRNNFVHTYRVLVTTSVNYTDTSVYQLVYFDSSTHVNFSNYDSRSASLEQYAGQTIHIAFNNRPVNYAGTNTGLYIDDVEIRSSKVPVVSLSAPSATNSHTPVTFTATLIEGSSMGLTYTWHSTLMDSTMVTTAPMLTMAYTLGGTDTMMVIASNAYGADTATATVSVTDCTPIATLPWEEDFNNVAAVAYNGANGKVPTCWHRYWNGSNADYAPHVIGNFLTNSPIYSYCQSNPALLLMAGTSNGYDSVAIVESCLFDVPLNRQMMSLTYMFQDPYCNSGTLSVGYMQDSTFVGVADVTRLAGGHTDTVRLNDFPPDVHRFALQWKKSGYWPYSGYWFSVIVDNIRVFAPDTLPTVHIQAPTNNLFVGDPTAFRAVLTNGLTDSLNYTWHSTLTGATYSSPVPYFNMVYTAAGIDTITVVATNAFGSSTDTAVVTVIDCSLQTVPWTEDFEGVTATSDNVAGFLPDCWNYNWNGSNNAYAPHVITTSGYQFLSNIPDNALFMVAARTVIGYDTQAEVMLPRFADSLHHLSLAFDYRFEAANVGTLVVGYYDNNVFTAVDTLAGHASNYLRDTVTFAYHHVDDNPHIVFRWNCSNSYFAVAIDNIEVYNDSTALLRPQVALDGPTEVDIFDTAIYTASLLRGDTAGITYTWHSTLMDSTWTDDTVVALAYPSIGVDTLQVTVTNGYGTHSASLVVHTNGCNHVGVPYVETFETVPPRVGNTAGFLPDCWTRMWSGAAVSSPYVTADSYEWNTTKKLQLIAGSGSYYGDGVATVVLPGFEYSINQLSLALDYMDSYLGTITVGYVVDTTYTPLYTLPGLYPINQRMATWRDTVNFNGVTAAGAHMAIRYQNSSPWSAVFIDNIEVFFTDQTGLPPAVALYGPSTADAFSSVGYTAALTGGDTTGVTFTWHSTLLDSTWVVSGANGVGTTQVLYTAIGVDTVTVTATTAFGSDMATHMVSVAWPVHLLPAVSLAAEAPFYTCDANQAQATLTAGDTTGLVITWHSSLLDSTISNAAPITLYYPVGGSDTLTVTAANAYGTATATKVVEVRQCEVANGMNYVSAPAASDTEFYCWKVWQFDSLQANISDPHGRWIRFADYYHNVRPAMMSTEMNYEGATSPLYLDDWLISPHIALPAATPSIGEMQTLTLRWNSFCDYSTFSVVLSTSGRDDPAAFTDTLYTETQGNNIFNDWETHTVDLTSYAGQIVCIAFHHTGPISWYGSGRVYMDSLMIDYNVVPVPTHTVTLSVNDTTMGTVSGAGDYNEGSMATIEATPNPGFLFVQWSDGDTLAIRTVKVDFDMSFTAYFEPVPQYTVTVNAVMDNGSQQDGLDEMVHGAGTYMDGDTVTLEGEVHGCATSFVYWITTEGDTLFDNPYTFIIHSDVTLTAVFAIFGGIDDVEGTAFTLHPNPAHDEVTVSVSQPSTLTVLDMAGREVIPPTPVTSELRIPTSGLPAGVYFVRIGEGVKKLIVR